MNDDLLDRYRRHLLAIYRTPCTCEDDTCAACIAEHALHLNAHAEADRIAADDLGYLAFYEAGGRFTCVDCMVPHSPASACATGVKA